MRWPDLVSRARTQWLVWHTLIARARRSSFKSSAATRPSGRPSTHHSDRLNLLRRCAARGRRERHASAGHIVGVVTANRARRRRQRQRHGALAAACHGREPCNCCMCQQACLLDSARVRAVTLPSLRLPRVSGVVATLHVRGHDARRPAAEWRRPAQSTVAGLRGAPPASQRGVPAVARGGPRPSPAGEIAR